MSVTTKSLFYATCHLSDPARVVLDLFALAGSGDAYFAHRTLAENDEYERLRRWLVDPELDYEELEVPEESLGERPTASELASAYRDGRSLWFDCRNPGLSDDIEPEFMEFLEEAVRGDTRISGIWATVGGHDIIGDRDSEDPKLLARATVSFGFFCYGSPHHMPRFCEEVFELPAMRKLREDLEAIVGPVRTHAEVSA